MLSEALVQYAMGDELVSVCVGGLARVRGPHEAIIIGGGIGGLCAGIALQRAGGRVAVYEAAPAPREVGAGLTLWPNALRALDQLGLGVATRAMVVI